MFEKKRHAAFLDGYFDAVGRSLTTESELVLLTCVFAESKAGDNGSWNPIGNWSSEFCAFARDFLAIDARSRLGFYLIEYVCWFEEFTEGACCFRRAKDDCGPANAIRYRIEWPDGSQVELISSRAQR